MIISHKYKFIFIKTSKVAGTSLELFLNNYCASNDILTPFWHPETGHTPRNYRGFFNPFRELTYRRKFARIASRTGTSRTIGDYICRRKFFEPIPAWQVKSRVEPRIWDTYYKFAVERNPWDKILSRYYQSKQIYEEKYGGILSLDGFLEYFEKQLLMPWTTPAWGSPAPYNYPRYVDPLTDQVIVDRIIRYENLNDELSEIFPMLDIPFSGSLDLHAKSSYRTERKPYREVLNNRQRSLIEKIFTKEINLLGYLWE